MKEKQFSEVDEKMNVLSNHSLKFLPTYELAMGSQKLKKAAKIN